MFLLRNFGVMAKVMVFNATYNDISVISVVFSGYSVSSTSKTDRHDITEILLKVESNTITLTLILFNL